MTEKESWLYLAKIAGNEPARRRKLLAYFHNPEEIFAASEEQLDECGFLEKNTIIEMLKQRKTDYGEELLKMQEAQIGFVTVSEPEYPSKLRDIPDAPHFLFFRGGLPKNNRPAVAIVGSRSCSGYGRMIATRFAGELACAGVDIISGLAMGVDGAAHKGALECGHDTFGVLGCGVDICYPSCNRYLYDAMREHGGILSEYYPGQSPMSYCFPQRNRIISGLSDAILVVEAREKSGTQITVTHALEQGREVYAIPGRVGDPLSSGCNRLIANGAVPALSSDDILSGLKNTYEILLSSERVKRDRNEKQAGLSKKDSAQTKILRMLFERPHTAEEIASALGLTVTETGILMVTMELDGEVKEEAPGIYIPARLDLCGL